MVWNLEIGWKYGETVWKCSMEHGNSKEVQCGTRNCMEISWKLEIAQKFVEIIWIFYGIFIEVGNNLEIA